jgi:hypothetical protein
MVVTELEKMACDGKCSWYFGEILDVGYVRTSSNLEKDQPESHARAPNAYLMDGQYDHYENGKY